MKIRPVGVGGQLFHAEIQTNGRTYIQTYMAKLIVAFRIFADAPKNNWKFLFLSDNVN